MSWQDVRCAAKGRLELWLFPTIASSSHILVAANIYWGLTLCQLFSWINSLNSDNKTMKQSPPIPSYRSYKWGNLTQSLSDFWSPTARKSVAGSLHQGTLSGVFALRLQWWLSKRLKLPGKRLLASEASGLSSRSAKRAAKEGLWQKEFYAYIIL